MDTVQRGVGRDAEDTCGSINGVLSDVIQRDCRSSESGQRPEPAHAGGIIREFVDLLEGGG